jgi:hypothetical protein
VAIGHDVNIPEGVTKIAAGSLDSAYGVTGTLIIPSTVTEFEQITKNNEDYADTFYGCRISTIIDNSPADLVHNMFSYNTSLTSITLSYTTDDFDLVSYYLGPQDPINSSYPDDCLIGTPYTTTGDSYKVIHVPANNLQTYTQDSA